MHHHHTLSQQMSTPASTSSHAPQQRRRKKRVPNYGTRTVEVRRGYNGFGFTISGQQPCRLSCIVTNSPADQAGLRSGDFLISVNGLNVSKLPHETVVQLIGNSFGSIRMQIAENYYSDSSDEENAALMMQQQKQQQQQQQLAGDALATQSGGQYYTTAATGSGLVGGARPKPRYMYHKTKIHRMRNSPQKKRSIQQQQQQHLHMQHHAMHSRMPPAGSGATTSKPPDERLRPLIEDLLLTTGGSQAAASLSRQTQRPTPVAGNNTGSLADVANVSAIVRVQTAALEYRAIVGYLGTIEMPKQISHSSKLQTVRSCIRKLRQEKRQPTTVLMTILPDCLRLQAVNGSVLATYPSERLNYVSSSSESENRFFGLVTSAVHTSQADDDEAGNGQADDGDSDEARRHRNDDPAAVAASAHTAGHISISNSCHVFVVDTKLCEHAAHVARATEFRIQCTKDPISSLCLEFPNNSEYVVNLIRSMYTMRILPPATRQAGEDGTGAAAHAPGAAAAHSPQPSNHSEISTTTSNSDSGIGFHNDCTNISDRIVVVDFPGLPTERLRPASSRPLGIFNNFDPLAIDKRLTVRAMPDPKTSPTSSQAPPGAPGSSSASTSHSVRSRPNLLANFNLIKSPATSLTATRSCDDVLALVERTAAGDCADHMSMPTHVSMDDISLHSSAATAMADDDHETSFTFLHPSCIDGLSAGGGQRKAIVALENYSSQTCEPRGRPSLSASATPSKLSPQVFKHDGAGLRSDGGHPAARQSLGFTAMDIASPKHEREVLTTMQYEMMETWRSLQDIHMGGHRQEADGVLDVTNSEPDLATREQPANVSPFRRVWQQSSFRTPRTDKQTYRQSPSVRRAASMTASDNDVYIKSMDGYINTVTLKDTYSAGSSQQRIDEENAPLKGQQQQQCLGAGPTMPGKTAIKLDFKLPQITTTLATPQPSSVVAPTLAAPVLSGTAAWRTSFEQLLDDPAGLQTFAEFLKKEFSAENIYFWTACERFRHLDNEAERVAQAVAIYAKHLSNAAMEPVNVDSHARTVTQEKLQSGERDIFVPAQKQIFNLMKFDSYQRFIRSDLYKKCCEAEEKQQALPYGVDDLEELLKTNFCQGASSKLKKSASNAEDRRRKSLLPWHRKTRSKSREHSDTGGGGSAGGGSTNGLTVTEGRKTSKIPQLSSSSLKLHSLTSSSAGAAMGGVALSDVHSSRSSLSSFDTLPAVISSTSSLCAQGAQAASQADMVVPLCRVILSDGATTIVQTRDDETVGQLVERLLEKRGLSYQFYDVIGLGSSKSIDLQSPAVQLAGTEVHVEQRVAFKLDLPDPKVISVKSKPKKQLHEVIKCILEKYNYSMESVVVRVRDTHSLVDLSQPVTVADGLRLQIVQLRPGEGAGKEVAATTTTTSASKFAKPSIPKSVTFPSSLTAKPAATPSGGPILKHPSQSTLDEITNRVFNELLHNKVEAHSSKPSDLCSIKSDDCGSETSSIFDRMRRRDSSSALKPKSKKKSTSSQHSEDTTAGYSIATSSSTTSLAHGSEVKKPLIAKLKAGVKLQVTERVAENQEELLEGLKRAQLARLEDQRGTEINFELPDFLKNKENMNAAASKLRKIRANLSPVAKTPPTAVPEEPVITPPCDRPQPAPRLSITNRNRAATISPMKIDEEPCPAESFDGSLTPALETNGGSPRGPPPLPPKPKVLPIKPTNWGVTTASTNGGGTSPHATSPIGGCLDVAAATHSNSIMPVMEVNRKSMLPLPDSSTHCAYLDQPSSSFV